MSSVIGNPILYWALAVVVILAAASLQGSREQLDAWMIYLAGLAGLAGAVLGGSGYALLFTPDHAPDSSQGRGVLGAFAGAAIFAWLALRWRGERFTAYADVAMPAVALGYAVYRVGCFLNGCCSGAISDLPWAVTFGPGTEAFSIQLAGGLIAPDAVHTLPVHPTQLYHAFVGLVAFLLLLRLRASVPGTRLVFAIGFYGATRLAIEFFRADAHPVLGPLDINQLACLAMVVVSGLVWAFRRSAWHSRLDSEEPSP